MPFKKGIRALNFKNLSGQTFGDLTVIEIDEEKSKPKYLVYKCLCKCGNFTTRTSNNLKSGKGKGCGCDRRGLWDFNWKGHGEIGNTAWCHIKRAAIKRNIDFNITIEFAWDLFLKQGRKCALSGLDLQLFTYKTIEGQQTASLDRIDSSKSYDIDNIRWIHKDINQMKGDMSDKELFYWCNLVINPFKNPDKIEIKQKHSKQFKGHGDIGNFYFKHLKRNADNRGHIFQITIEDIWNQFIKQGLKCAITNEYILFNPYSHLKDKQTASVDRIDPIKGYFKENIQVVHKTINRLKWKLSQKRFKEICYLIHNLRKTPSLSVKKIDLKSN